MFEDIRAKAFSIMDIRDLEQEKKELELPYIQYMQAINSFPAEEWDSNHEFIKAFKGLYEALNSEFKSMMLFITFVSYDTLTLECVDAVLDNILQKYDVVFNPKHVEM